MIMQFNKTLLASVILSLASLTKADIFEAEGYGDTAEAAKQDAVNNAIKFSVGEFVVNKEELSGDEFNQNVISYSNAYVKKIELVSQKQQGAQFVANVKVDIESQKLIKALQDKQVAKADNVVDSSLLVEVSNREMKKSTNQKNLQDFGKLVDEFVIKPIKENKQIVHIDILGKLKPTDMEVKDSNGNDLIIASLPIRIRVDEDYVNGIRKVIKELETTADSDYAYIGSLRNNRLGKDYRETTILMDDRKRVLLNEATSQKCLGTYVLTLLDKDNEIIEQMGYYVPSMYDSHADEEEKVRNSLSDGSREFLIVKLYESMAGYLCANTDISYSSGSVETDIHIPLRKEELSELNSIQIEHKLYVPNFNLSNY